MISMIEFLKELEAQLEERRRLVFGFTSVEEASYADGGDAMLEAIIDRLREKIGLN